VRRTRRTPEPEAPAVPDVPDVLVREMEMVPHYLLERHPQNPNQGDLGVIAESIRTNGFFTPLIASRASGFILIGNHRFAAGRELGLETFPVHYLEDLTPEQERRILLADNRTARLGADDPNQLAKLLAELSRTPAGLFGTGYDGDDLDHLLTDLSRSAATAAAPIPPGGVPIPPPTARAEPGTDFDHVIEIRCAAEDLAVFRPTLAEWIERDGVQVNVS
jgi:hypothetical protein